MGKSVKRRRNKWKKFDFFSPFRSSLTLLFFYHTGYKLKLISINVAAFRLYSVSKYLPVPFYMCHELIVEINTHTLNYRKREERAIV